MKERVVLLIDDEENVVNSIRRLLRKEPYTLLSTTILPKRRSTYWIASGSLW